MARSFHERGAAEADCRSTLAPRFKSSLTQQAEGRGQAVTSYSRAKRVDRPALPQPLGHLLQSPCCADRKISSGSGRESSSLLAVARYSLAWLRPRAYSRSCVPPSSGATAVGDAHEEAKHTCTKFGFLVGVSDGGSTRGHACTATSSPRAPRKRLSSAAINFKRSLGAIRFVLLIPCHMRPSV